MKIKLISLLLGLALMLSSCGGGKDKKPAPGAEAPEEVEVEQEEKKPQEIEEKEAAKILGEKLSSLGLKGEFSEFTEVDEVDVFLYSVVNNDGKESDEMLAVNAVSGEVMVYDPAKDKLLPYERFSMLKDKSSERVSWDGGFYLAPRTVTLMPADDNSFEFTITKDGSKEPEFFGVAYTGKEDREAEYEENGLKITFIMSGDSLEIKEEGKKAGISGVYERQE